MVETPELSDVNQHTENAPFTMVFSARTGIPASSVRTISIPSVPLVPGNFLHKPW